MMIDGSKHRLHSSIEDGSIACRVQPQLAGVLHVNPLNSQLLG